MKQPKISVIVPVYNAEKYLPLCLDSILAQTYENFEVICVDDGSTDGSLAVLKKYEKKDARVKVIHQENQGVSAARSCGMDNAAGDYLYFMDSDDFIRPEWFARAAEVIAEHEPDCVMCDYREMTDYLPFEDELPHIKAQKIENPLWLLIQRHSPIYPNLWTKMYKVTMLNGQHFDKNLFYVEDLWFNIEACAKTKSFYHLPQQMYGYIRRDNSITISNFNERKARGFLNICANVQKYFGNTEYFATMRDNISNLNLKFMMKNMHKLPANIETYERRIAELLHSGAVGYKNLPLKFKFKLWRIGRKYK